MEFKKILTLMVVAIVAIAFSVPSQAQLLDKKRGTIMDKILNQKI